jgi:benzoate-CoA ligase
MPDRIEWPIAFLGSMYAGLIPVAVNTLLTFADYTYLVEHSDASSVVTTNDLPPNFVKVTLNLPGKGNDSSLWLTVRPSLTAYHLAHFWVMGIQTTEEQILTNPTWLTQTCTGPRNSMRNL